MNIEEAVGAELRACRRKKQVSQEQLGFDAGIHRTYVSLIERGAKSPTLGVLFRYPPEDCGVPECRHHAQHTTTR